MEQGFVKIRRGILEHLENGWITGMEYLIYLHLIIKADYNTGVVWQTSGQYIANTLELHRHTVNKVLRSLEDGSGHPSKSQYIKRLLIPRSKNPYPILINGYEVKNKGRLVSDKSLSIKELIYESVSDNIPDSILGDIPDRIPGRIRNNKNKRKKEINKRNDEVLKNLLNGKGNYGAF